MKRLLACLVLLTAASSTSLIAKGPTTRITIRDLSRGFDTKVR